MNLKEWLEDPFRMLAGALGLAVVVAGVGWAISQILRAIGQILPALGTGLGNVLAGAIHGTVSGVVVGWATTIGIVGATAVAGGAGVLLVIKVVEQTKVKPFYPTVAVLSVMQTFLLDLAKEFWPGERLVKFLFKASTALLFAVSAALWVRGGWRGRVCAVLLYLLLPAMVLIEATKPYIGQPLSAVVAQVDYGVWFALGGFLLFAFAVLLLAQILND